MTPLKATQTHMLCMPREPNEKKTNKNSDIWKLQMLLNWGWYSGQEQSYQLARAIGGWESLEYQASLFHVMHNTYAGRIQYNYPHVYTHIPDSASTPTGVGTCVCVLYQCCEHVHTLVLRHAVA